jgi:TorA maturation chaperone TorD
MSSAELLQDTMAVDLARECLYRFLATVLRDPASPAWRSILSADNQRLAGEAGKLLREEALTQTMTLGFGELPPSELDLRPLLALFAEPIEAQVAEYDRVFGLVIAKECPPYETEYYPAKETFQRSQQLADIAGFYRAFGIEPSMSTPERPDHIALELEFMAILSMKKRLALLTDEDGSNGMEQAMICEDAARKFFTDHLCWWVPAFATGLRRKAGAGLYAAVAGVLAAWIPAERMRLGVPPARMAVQATLVERPEEQAGCADCTA